MADKQHLRAAWHNYKSRCIYMLTMTKAHTTPCFGEPAGSCTKDETFINLSETGRLVKRWIGRLSGFNKDISLLQYTIMPDHIHLLIYVRQPIDEHLGYYIARWKLAMDRDNGDRPILEKGYNDQILKPDRSLDNLYRYIRENPWRLHVRQQRPDFFRRVNNICTADHHFQAYGNVQLLANPFKDQVIVHRRDDETTRRHNRERWLYTAANGGVLVSPFISPDEKSVRAEAESLGARMIVLRPTPFATRQKPSSHDFELCASGRLLLLSPTDDSFPKEGMRAQCLAMNAIAAAICKI